MLRAKLRVRRRTWWLRFLCWWEGRSGRAGESLRAERAYNRVVRADYELIEVRQRT